MRGMSQRAIEGTDLNLHFKAQKILALITLIANIGISVTGSIVRVTGSGLGCNTWPNCHAGSLVPVEGAAPAIHQAIEFGNRLLTFVLVVLSFSLFIVVLHAKRRKEIILLTVFVGLGIVAQAIIGGITVLLQLQWSAVALHFLVSIILVWISALLYLRVQESDWDEPSLVITPALRAGASIAAIALAIVVVTGTLVTGSGPHAGDAEVGAEGRLAFDTLMLTYVHAGAMYVYLLITVVVAIFLHKSGTPKDIQRIAKLLILFIIIQWGIGVLQVYLGVPEWAVPLHVLMSTVVVTYTAFLWGRGRSRTFLTES